MLPKYALSALCRKQITDFLALPYKTRETKSQLIRQLYKLIVSDPQTYACLLNTFSRELAVGPSETQQILRCSSTERRCWIQEGKLPVFYHRTYYRALRNHGVIYPVHERQMILGLTQEEVAMWRTEHQIQVQQQSAACRYWPQSFSCNSVEY